MKVIKVKDQVEGGKEALKVFKEALDNGVKVFGLATGSTPETTYDELVKSDIDFSNSISVNLDEYVGIDRKDPQSYYTFMYENLFKDIDIDLNNTHVPYGNTEADCKAYEDALSEVSIDLQVLGIGQNGHIGFNEPGTPFETLTHIVDLTENTREANARFFDNDINKVPTQAISMGIGTIMKSKKVLLVANGENKADAIKAMIEGPIDTACAASALQNHADVVVVLDKAAASKLTK